MARQIFSKNPLRRSGWCRPCSVRWKKRHLVLEVRQLREQLQEP